MSILKITHYARRIVICAVVSLVFLVVSEYLSIEYETKVKPSDAFKWTADRAQDFWELVGKTCARISAIFHIFYVDTFIEAILNFVNPSIRFVLSWTYAFKGYIETIDLYEHPKKVVFGSFVFSCVIVLLVYRYYPLGRAFASQKLWRFMRWIYIDEENDDQIDNNVSLSSNAEEETN